MKKILLIFIILFNIVNGAAVIDYRIGTAGQSNMQGMDNTNGSTTPSLETWVWTTKDIKFTETYSSIIPNFTKAVQSYYPGISLSYTRTEVGSMGVVDVWSDTSTATYKNSIIKLQASTIDVMLYFGGESDIAAGKTKAEFKAAFLLMMSNFRSDLSMPNLKFYIIKPYASAYTEAANDSIRLGLDELESAGELVIVGDALPWQGGLIDAIHLNRFSQDTLGTNAGTIFAPLINFSFYVTPEQIGNYDNSNTLFSIIPNAESDFRLTDANTGFAYIFNSTNNISPISMSMSGFASGYGFKTKTDSTDAYYAYYATTAAPITTNNMLYATSAIGSLSVIAEIYMASTINQVAIFDQRDPLSNNIIFTATGGILYLFFNYGGANSYATMNVAGNIPSKERVFVSFSFNGQGLTNADKVVFYVNGIDKSSAMSFVGAIDTITPSTGGVLSTTKTYGSTGCNLYGLEVKNTTMTTQDNLDYIALGSGKGGLVGISNGADGTMELTLLSTTNLRQNKYFRFAKSFMSWSRRKLRL